MKNVKLFDLTEGGKDVSREASHLWRHLEFGNDHYYFETTLAELREISPIYSEVFVWPDKDNGEVSVEERGWHTVDINLIHIPKHIESLGVTEDETILIHWWW